MMLTTNAPRRAPGMLSLCVSAGLIAVLGTGVLGCASDDAGQADAAASDTVTLAVKPVNTICPIGKEAVTPEGGVVDVNGETVAFCCAGCQGFFATVPAEAQARFVELAKQGKEMDFEL